MISFIKIILHIMKQTPKVIFESKISSKLAETIKEQGNIIWSFSFPSIAEGMGDLIDLTGVGFASFGDLTPGQMDKLALHGDCLAIGNDMKDVIKYEHLDNKNLVEK